MASTFATDTGYERLTVKEVLAALPGLDSDDLDSIEALERSGKSRTTVLRRVAALRAAALRQPGPGSSPVTAGPAQAAEAAPTPSVSVTAETPSVREQPPPLDTPHPPGSGPGSAQERDGGDGAGRPASARFRNTAATTPPSSPPVPPPSVGGASLNSSRNEFLRRAAFGAIAVLAMVGVFSVPSLRADTSGYKAAQEEAISDSESNNLSAKGAPQQEVVNGWVARDLLAIQTAQQNDELTLLSVIASLLVLLTIAVCGVGAVISTDGRKRAIADGDSDAHPA